MKKRLTKTQKAASQMGSILGKANVKKHGRGHMSQISKDYWNSPAGRKRRKGREKLTD